MATKKRIRVVDARGKVKDSPDKSIFKRKEKK